MKTDTRTRVMVAALSVSSLMAQTEKKKTKKTAHTIVA